MFLRKSRIEPLPVTMSAVRMGERVLQIGIDDPALASALAAKVGLSGNAAIAVTDDEGAARARSAAASAGVLVDVQVTPLAPLPFESGAFDLVIAHSMHGLVSSLDANARTAALREWHRVLRDGRPRDDHRGRPRERSQGLPQATARERELRRLRRRGRRARSGGVPGRCASSPSARATGSRKASKHRSAFDRGQPDRPAEGTSIAFAAISGLNRPRNRGKAFALVHLAFNVPSSPRRSLHDYGGRARRRRAG